MSAPPDRLTACARVARADLHLLQEQLLALLPEGDPARARVSRAIVEAHHQIGVATVAATTRAAELAREASDAP